MRQTELILQAFTMLDNVAGLNDDLSKSELKTGN